AGTDDVVPYKEIHALKKKLAGISQNAKEGSHDEMLADKLVREIDDMTWSLTPNDIAGGNVTDLHSNLAKGDELWGRYQKSKTLEESWKKIGRSQAAQDGNIDSAISTEVRAILNSPRRRKGFSASELAEMDQMISGKGGQNIGRWFRGFSPTQSSQRGSSGPLIAAGELFASGMGGSAGYATGGVPGALVGTALGATVPPIAGAVGGRVANNAATKQFNTLLDIIQRGEPETLEMMVNRLYNPIKQMMDPSAAAISAVPWEERD
ncbi:MAG: hypothetical protein DRI46_09765, partial [Chloroflexi bacterium]